MRHSFTEPKVQSLDIPFGSRNLCPRLSNRTLISIQDWDRNAHLQSGDNIVRWRIVMHGHLDVDVWYDLGTRTPECPPRALQFGGSRGDFGAVTQQSLQRPIPRNIDDSVFNVSGQRLGNELRSANHGRKSSP
jgi:hypothetical protein